MYGIIKTVIEAKGYDLKGMLTKIDNFWVNGRLTETERNKLISLAQQNAHIKNEVDVVAKMEEFDMRLKELEEKFANQPGEDVEKPEVVEYPEYTVGKWYYAGDVVMFEGTAYKCIAPNGAVCTWSPSEYPTYWNALYIDSEV